MTLFEKQERFPELLCLLFLKAKELGFTVTLGEAYRPPEMAAIYAHDGRGIKDSLHTERLAIDLNLFRNGVYLTLTEDYAPLGEYWEALSTADLQCCWGGRFSRADGNHFSLADNGKK